MEVAGLIAMAKKKKQTAPEQWKTKPIILQMRGSSEFKAWLESLAEHDASNMADLAERALAHYARLVGFTVPRPKR